MAERLGGPQKRTAEKVEYKTVEQGGLEVPGKLERMARRILGLRQLELAVRRGGQKGKEEGDRIVAEELGVGTKLLEKLDLYLEISPEATGVGLEESEREKHCYPYLDPWEKKLRVAPLQEIVTKLGRRPALFAIKAASEEDYRRLLLNTHRF